MRIWWALFLGLILFCTAPLMAMDESERLDLYHQGKEAFREANAIRSQDRVGAEALYRKAALRFERLRAEGELESGKLYYNLGNTYFLLGDLGRAILNYRRAERLLGDEVKLAQNLAYARSRRADRFERPARTVVLGILLFWHYDLSLAHRSLLFAGLWGVLWVLAAVRLYRSKAVPRALLLAVAALVLLLLGSMGVQWHAERNQREGVITAPEVVGRKGDGETYTPAFTSPLHAGTEFVLLESRAGWARIELPDTRRCWIPETAFECL
ncbi:MAG: SH3 domain-containing protein [Planctomycetota bacterium]|jgi:tetratricopeptide (TPR) repeat protein